MEKLLKALAFQIGSEVSYHELAQLSGLDRNMRNEMEPKCQLSLSQSLQRELSRTRNQNSLFRQL